MAGTIQMSGIEWSREIFGEGDVVMLGGCRTGICYAAPQRAGIERLGGENGQDDGGGEGDDSAAGLHRGELPELDEACQERGQEHVQHRPPAYEIEGRVDARQPACIPRGAIAHAEYEPREARELQKGDDNACGEDYDRDGAQAVTPELDGAGEDRVIAGIARRRGRQDREQVRGYQHDRGGQRERGGGGAALGREADGVAHGWGAAFAPPGRDARDS